MRGSERSLRAFVSATYITATGDCQSCLAAFLVGPGAFACPVNFAAWYSSSSSNAQDGAKFPQYFQAAGKESNMNLGLNNDWWRYHENKTSGHTTTTVTIITLALET